MMTSCGMKGTEMRKTMEFNAYLLPIGSEFTLGKRRWRLVLMDDFHPDFMTFHEISAGAHTPDRVFNPSEIQALFELGVQFDVPLVRTELKSEAADA